MGTTLHALGLRWTSSDAAAAAYARSVAGRPGVDRRMATRLARLCFEIGDGRAAAVILDALPEDSRDLTSLALSAEIDWRLGRYQRAVATADRILAARPRDLAARRIRDRAGAELTVLDPAWRPPLGPARPRPEPVPGRVLHLLTNSLPYRQAGYTVRSQQVARSQLEAGLDPRMATRAGFPANAGTRHAPPTSTIDGITYHRILPDLDPAIGLDRLVTRNAVALQDLISTLRPAVLQPTTNHVNAQMALALGERFRIPVVYEIRGFLEETWLSRNTADSQAADRYVASREVETACMRAADGLVTLSETMRAEIIARGDVDPDRIIVVPNAVDVARFVPGPRNPALARELGIGSELVIGYISSFTAYEGIVYLIEATAELRRRGRQVRCLLVGDGEVRAELEASAAAEGLLDDRTVIFTGRVPHDRVLDYYRLIDVFVVPRTNDRVSQLVTPLKPYEAMAMERALVVSGVDALLEIVSDGETGRSFIPEDPISLADVVEPLIDDPGERQRLGSAARDWVATHRNWASNGRRYLDLFRKLGAA
jgi:glycosyltransferase involved in cell wall biosynthesis